jgi:hypothetical protein
MHSVLLILMLMFLLIRVRMTSKLLAHEAISY